MKFCTCFGILRIYLNIWSPVFSDRRPTPTPIPHPQPLPKMGPLDNYSPFPSFSNSLMMFANVAVKLWWPKPIACHRICCLVIMDKKIVQNWTCICADLHLLSFFFLHKCILHFTLCITYTNEVTRNWNTCLLCFGGPHADYYVKITIFNIFQSIRLVQACLISYQLYIGYRYYLYTLFISICYIYIHHIYFIHSSLYNGVWACKLFYPVTYTCFNSF